MNESKSRGLPPSRVNDTQFAKLVVFVCSLVPLALLGLEILTDRAGPDERAHTLKVTGISALIFLSLSLAITPLRILTKKNYWSHFRRMLGLYAFLYAAAHVVCYLHYDLKWKFPKFFSEILNRNFIFFGMLAFALMIPLAATSTAASVKRLGAKRWKWLHRLVYLTAISASIHYLLFPKILQLNSLPALFAMILGGLLFFRLVDALRKTSRKQAESLG